MRVETRSSVLRRFAEEVATDGQLARGRLVDALLAAEGPLLEPLPGQSGAVLVTFVLVGPTEQPYASCQLLPGFPVETPMRPIPGAPDVWWAEAVAPPGASTVYQFQDSAVAEPQGADRRDPETVTAYLRELHRVSYADPVNPHSCYPLTALSLDPLLEDLLPEERWLSVVRPPGAAVQRRDLPPERRGRLTHYVAYSAALGNSRAVTLWSPPGVSTAGLPVVVLLDGESFLHGMDAPGIFDCLLAGGRARPFTAVLVHNAAPQSRLTEYVANPAFETFLADELLPQVLDGTEPPGPDDVLVGGFSLGGLAAGALALNRPDRVGGVVALSPSLWWSPDGEPEWLTRELRRRGPTRTRYWLEVGSLEAGTDPGRGAGTSMVDAARRLRDVLAAGAGELLGYRERPGGHDAVSWCEGIAAGLSGHLGPETRPLS